MTSKVKFSYLRDPEDSGRVICVARRLVGDEIEFGISVCNPLDSHAKKFARRIAEGRLEKHPVSLFIEPGVHPMETICKEASKHARTLLPPKKDREWVYPTFLDRTLLHHLDFVELKKKPKKLSDVSF